MMDTKTQVRNFIFEKFPLAQKKGLRDDESLLDGGIVDSMGILEIVGFLEDDLHLELADEDVLADHFQSIDHITELVESKRKSSQA